jgi:hypothetical protein
MVRVVSLAKLNDEGARAIESSGDTAAKIRELPLWEDALPNVLDEELAAAAERVAAKL